MSDPYSEWFDIPPHLRPPTYYQLLGIAPTELDPHAIAAAADRRLDRLRAHETGPGADEYRRLAQEVAQARDTLIDPVSRLRYDTLAPDAADPWWKAETGAPPSAETEPVEGWWQSENPDVDLPPPAPSAPAAAPELSPAQPPLPPPLPTKSNDWWKAEPGTAVAEPPPVRLAAPSPPVTPASMTPPPPVQPAAAPVPAPVIREQSLAYASPRASGSPIPLVLAGLFVAGLAGGAVLYLTKPWAARESSDDKLVAEHRPGPEPGPAAVSTGTTDVTARPAPATTVPKPAVTRPTVTQVPSTSLSPPKNPTPESDDVVEPMTFRGHKSGVFGVAVSRTGKTILSVSDDQGVLHYSPQERGKHGLLHKLGSPGVAIALCNEDRTAVFCDGGEVVVYDVSGRKPQATFENPRGGIRSLAAAPDGSFVLTGTTDGVVRWWNPKTKGIEHTLDVDAKATVTALAVTPDARTAAVGLSDGRLALWDLKGRREIKRWMAHKGAVTALAYSPDGQRVVSGGEDGIAIVWQPGGTLVRKLAGHEGPVTGAAWCSEGKRVITAGIDRTVRLWAEDKGWKADRLANTPDKAFCLALDARDRFALVGLADGAVQLLPLPKAATPPGDVPGP